MQKSSVTGMSAAVFQHSIGKRVAQKDSDGRTYYVRRLIGSVVASGDLVIETEDAGVVKVPAGAFRFDAEERIEALPSTSGQIPEACQHLVEGFPLYGEQFLSVGDIVELQATVRPCRDPEIDLEVDPEHDAVLVDRTLEAMGIDVEGLRQRKSRVALLVIGGVSLLIFGVTLVIVISTMI